MKKLLLLIALMPGFLFAQNPEKAKEILDQVTAKTKTFKTIKANFSFKMENLQEDIDELYEGTISIKGEKFKVSASGLETYFDGKVRWVHMIEDEEVNVDEPDEEDEDSLNPAKIFSMFESGFNYAYLGEKTIGGVAVYAIDLFPINRDKPYSRVKMEIRKSDLRISQIKQVGKNGNNYTIVIKKMETNLPMDDSMFVFDEAANPNVDVIDMR